METPKLKDLKHFGYIRVSTDKQNVEIQRSEILTYAHNKNFRIDKFIDIEISSRKNLDERRIVELMGLMQSGDSLIVTELSRIGRSTQEILKVVNEMINKGLIIHIIKQNLILNPLNKNDATTKIMITMWGLFAELERDLISQRTKEALRVKKLQGVRLGKPKGTIQKSKYDKDMDRIIELLNLGLSMNATIKKHLKYGSVESLRNWIKTRLDKIIINEVENYVVKPDMLKFKGVIK